MFSWRAADKLQTSVDHPNRFMDYLTANQPSNNAMHRDPIQIGLGQVPDVAKAQAEQVGFRFGDTGTHTSRTIMLAELSNALRVCKPQATRADYVAAVVDENCLGKHTQSTRKTTLQRLTELYALDEKVTLFRTARHFWYADEKAHGLIALLLSLARDPLLRATAPAVLALASGDEIARQKFTDAIRDAVSGRLNDATLDKVVRNAASSWTQSGHLDGRSRKRRLAVTPTPGAVAFALLLGYLLGVRGQGLFETLFARLLDRDVTELSLMAMEAKRLGLLDIKSGGGMLVVSFDGILTDKEKGLSHGAH